MFLFGKNKKRKASNSQIVWRDSNGAISCPGDNCPQKCDESCPIWLNTTAATMIAIGQNNTALSLLEDAAALAPDFYDAWNNIGALHGQNRDYQKSYDAYMKAHTCNPQNFQPVFGLALSTRDLKRYEECLQWCDKYDQLCSDGGCEKIRATAKAALSSDVAGATKSSALPSPISICTNLLPLGHKDGFVISDGSSFPHIPEIACQATAIASRMLDEFRKIDPSNYLSLAPAWAAYAAMGAVRLWNDNWDELKQEGIFESLTEPRGLDEMDEYVTDLIGWNFGSPKSDKFVKHLHIACEMAIAASNVVTANSREDRKQCTLNATAAMFYYGMIIEMNELGMT